MSRSWRSPDRRRQRKSGCLGLGVDGEGVALRSQGATRRHAGGALATAERCADLTLGSTEALYRTLVESCGELIVLIAADGCLAFVKGACQELLGYERCEMLGRELGDLLALDAAGWGELTTARPADESVGVRRQLKATRKDGARLAVAFSAVSIGDHTGRGRSSR